MNRSPMDDILALLPFLPFFFGSEVESDTSASDVSAAISGVDASAAEFLTSAAVEEGEGEEDCDGDDTVIVSMR